MLTGLGRRSGGRLEKSRSCEVGGLLDQADQGRDRDDGDDIRQVDVSRDAPEPATRTLIKGEQIAGFQTGWLV